MSGQSAIFKMMFDKSELADSTTEEPAEKEVGPTKSRSTQACLDALKAGILFAEPGLGKGTP